MGGTDTAGLHYVTFLRLILGLERLMCALLRLSILMYRPVLSAIALVAVGGR